MGQGVTRGLPDADVGQGPFALFASWFEEATESGILLPDAMNLATATPDGRPSARMVLLKGFDDRGFRFFTNFGSRKAAELDQNPHVALTLHWAVLQRQVRIEGTVERLPAEESDEYFQTRARGSQLGAWASRQSATLDGREQLQERLREVEAQFADAPVSLPPFWGGFRVRPKQIEFWQGRANRLHDRVVFTREGTDWVPGRLFP